MEDVTMSLKIPAELKLKLDSAAKNELTSTSAIVRRVLNERFQ